MSENENIKYPRKSERYKGVYQRKNGTWFYRFKRVFIRGDKPKYIQESGFATEEAAHKAMLLMYRSEHYRLGDAGLPMPNEKIGKFGDIFKDFLVSGLFESEATRKKYKALYDAQLKMWENMDVSAIKESHIDVLLLRMALKPYSPSYQSSVRKLLKLFFYYVNLLHPYISGELAQGIVSKPYKLRVLSLFSGIGAPEQALKNIGIDYELVNFCEIDNTAAKAYCELHNVSEKLRIKDVNDINVDFAYDKLPKYDLMVFGFPCVDISTQGNMEGIMKEGNHPTIRDLRNDNLGEITRSGLFYKALQIALWSRPKFMIAENVSRLLGDSMEYDFGQMLKNLQEAGYNVYYKTLNSKDFNIPQSRRRAFLVMIRSDLNMDFKFPDSLEPTVTAEEWFVKDAPEECYATAEQEKYIINRDNFKSNFKRDVISCITTGWGTPSYTNQTFVKDGERIRCLTSEELMRFQGFPPEYGTKLLDIGISRNQIGQLVGNSITVNVLEAIFREFKEGLSSQLSADVLSDKFSVARNDKDFIDPFISYMGNKTKLLPYLDYLLPKDIENCTFVDLFTGAATVAINVNARKIVINDTDTLLTGIYKALSTIPPEDAWKMVMDIVNKYKLSATNKKGYELCRDEFNEIPVSERANYWYWGLALIYHSFNRSHVAYNDKGKYNSSFGKEKCNLRLSKDRFIPFATKLYEGDFEIYNKSYDEIDLDAYKGQDIFLYVDPPYLITQAPYNKGWSDESDKELYDFLDRCTEKGIKWMLSNVIENKKPKDKEVKKNHILIDWIQRNHMKYHVYFMKRDYKNSIYKHKGTEVDNIVDNELPEEGESRTLEVVVTNYK